MKSITLLLYSPIDGVIKVSISIFCLIMNKILTFIYNEISFSLSEFSLVSFLFF